MHDNFSDKHLKFVPKLSLSYIQPSLAIVVTIAAVKVILIPDIYTLAIV